MQQTQMRTRMHRHQQEWPIPHKCQQQSCLTLHRADGQRPGMVLRQAASRLSSAAQPQ